MGRSALKVREKMYLWELCVQWQWICRKKRHPVNYNASDGISSIDILWVLPAEMLCRWLNTCFLLREGGRQHLRGLEDITASPYWIKLACLSAHFLSLSKGQRPSIRKKQVCISGLQSSGTHNVSTVILPPIILPPKPVFQADRNKTAIYTHVLD